MGWKRGCKIVLALRIYKNKHGSWPKSLEDIEPLVSSDTLIDPFSGEKFVYEVNGDNFTLYSADKNENYLENQVGEENEDNRITIWK